jgi:hypothetical protein
MSISFSGSTDSRDMTPVSSADGSRTPGVPSPEDSPRHVEVLNVKSSKVKFSIPWKRVALVVLGVGLIVLGVLGIKVFGPIIGLAGIAGILFLAAAYVIPSSSAAHKRQVIYRSAISGNEFYRSE